MHHGDVTKPHNQKFALWEPLATTATALKSAKITSVPMAPFQHREFSLNTPVSARGDFCAGFVGDWSAGMPREVELAFFTNLFNSLQNIVATPEIGSATVKIPSAAAVEAGLIDTTDESLAQFSGRKIFCMGTSIVERARLQLLKLPKIYKIDASYFNPIVC